MTINPARYCKDSLCCTPEDSRGGMKNKESWLLESLNGRYSHREGGYIVPASKEKVLRKMLEMGWKGKPRFFPGQKSVFISPEGEEFSYGQAKKKMEI